MRQVLLSFAAPCLLALSSLLLACGGQSEPEPSATAGAGGAEAGGAGSGGAGAAGVSAGIGGAGFGGQFGPGECKPSTVKRCIEGKIVDTSCCNGPFNDSCMPMPIATCADGSCAASASLCPGGAGAGGGGAGGQGGGGSSSSSCVAPDFPSTVTRCVGGKLAQISCCAGPFNDSCMPSQILTCADGSCAEAFQGCPGGAGGGSGACGDEPPAKGDPCKAGQECTWGDKLGVCGPEGWFVGHKTGVQLAPDAPCNPLGKWDLSYEPAEETGFFCTEPYEPDLEVRASDEGSLIAEFLDGDVEISADGCSIKASTHQSFTNPSESWSASTAVELKLTGDQGSGTYTKSNSGFCSGKKQGKLAAKRL